jgi:hypothetical protein
VAWCQEPEITLNMKIDYLADVLHSFGKTALIFHGGASFGKPGTLIVQPSFTSFFKDCVI